MSRPTEVLDGRLLFAYHAVRPDGSEESGELAAPSREAAREQLARSGLFPSELRARAAVATRNERIEPSQIALGLRLLASMLGAGLPLERALSILPSVAPRGWSPGRLEALREAVREGATLAAGLRSAGCGLPGHVTGIIEAGEASGALAESLRDVAQLTERTAMQRAAIRQAVAYPVILAIAGLTATALLAGVVLPRFAELLADAGQQLPAAARALLFAGDLASRWWGPLLAATGIATVWAVRRLQGDGGFRRRLHERLLALPVIGPLRQATAGTRLTGALASMLARGVPLASALSHGAAAAGDEAIAARVLAAREGVIRGERLSRAFADESVVRPGVLQLIRAGEASGEVADMLRTSAQVEGEWGMARIRALTALIEPALILGFGALIAFVAAAVLQAVYSIRPMP